MGEGCNSHLKVKSWGKSKKVNCASRSTPQELMRVLTWSNRQQMVSAKVALPTFSQRWGHPSPTKTLKHGSSGSDDCLFSTDRYWSLGQWQTVCLNQPPTTVGCHLLRHTVQLVHSSISTLPLRGDRRFSHEIGTVSSHYQFAELISEDQRNIKQKLKSFVCLDPVKRCNRFKSGSGY